MPRTPLPSPRLLADVGGTHARFAWQAQAQAPLTDVAVYRCAESASLGAAIRRYLDAHGRAMPPQCAIAIANPVTGDAVRMTNHDWSFSIAALTRELGCERLLVLNDFTAQALALPTLSAAHLRAVGGGTAAPGEALAVLGPGTGLGVSGLVPAGDGAYAPIAGEGGHVTLASNDELEARVLQQLHRRFGHVSAERALSGPGLVNLYDGLCSLEGPAPEPLAPADVMARAQAGTDTRCVRALDLFCSFLGDVAGNLALTLGARGGVYIGGGIVPRMLDTFAASRFRARFEAKGRFAGYLAQVPTWVITSTESPAFAGAARALDAAEARSRRRSGSTP